MPNSVLPNSVLPNSVLPNSVLPDCLLELEIAGGHRLRVSGASCQRGFVSAGLRVSGAHDPEALARLIRGLSG